MKQKEEKVVRKYNILLRGKTVDVVVELIKLQGRMDATKNNLKKSIKRFSDDNSKIEACLELEDELKYVDIQVLYNGIFSIIQWTHWIYLFIFLDISIVRMLC